MISANNIIIIMTLSSFLPIIIGVAPGQMSTTNINPNSTIPITNTTITPLSPTTPPTTTSTTPPPPTTPTTTPPPTTTTPSTSSTTSVTPSNITSTTIITTHPSNSTPTPTVPSNPTTVSPVPKNKSSFNASSFIGGMVLAFGLVGIGFMSWKYYKSRTERNYRTL